MTVAQKATVEAKAATPEVYPIEMSGHGSNTHYIHCTQVGWAQNYAVCQHIIKTTKAGVIGKSMPECQRAICQGNCPAIKMLEEEKSAGHAIYYKPRERHWEDPSQKESENKSGVNYNSDSYKRGRYGLSAVTKPKPATTAKPKAKKVKDKLGNITNNLDAAAVVNELAKEAHSPPTEMPPREQGESPVAYQKRLRSLGLL
jgi:hypothetical protein